MRCPTEDELRAALDERGVLRPGALGAPARREAYTVFAQRGDACMDALAWQHHARTFFGARVGLTIDKRYEGAPRPRIDAARVIIADEAGPGDVRFVFGRPRGADDLVLAEQAEARGGGAGLALLARRCGTVWLIGLEREDDRAALRLAAVLASVELGPILAPVDPDDRRPRDGPALFGVRTARALLDGA